MSSRCLKLFLIFCCGYSYSLEDGGENLSDCTELEDIFLSFSAEFCVQTLREGIIDTL